MKIGLLNSPDETGKKCLSLTPMELILMMFLGSEKDQWLKATLLNGYQYINVSLECLE